MTIVLQKYSIHSHDVILVNSYTGKQVVLKIFLEMLCDFRKLIPPHGTLKALIMLPIEITLGSFSKCLLKSPILASGLNHWNTDVIQPCTV